MIVVIGNYGSTNIGDEAILHGFLKKNYLTNKEEKVIVFSSNPSYTIDCLKDFNYYINVDIVYTIPTGIRSFFKSIFTFSILKNIFYIKKANKIIFAGGGLLQDDEIAAIWIWFFRFLFCRVLNKNIEWHAISIGPINYKISKKIINIIIKYSKYISVRDKNFFLNNQKFFFEEDYVLLLDLFKDYNIVYDKSDNKNNIFIGVSLRLHKKMNNDFLSKFMQVLYNVQQKYNNIYFITLPFETYKNDDRNILSKLNLSNIYYINSFFKPCDIIRQMCKCDIIIGMRLHSLIFANKLNIPYIPIIYSPKINNFVSELDIKYLDISNFNYEYFFNQLNNLLLNIKKYKYEK